MLKLLFSICVLLMALGIGAWASTGFSPETKTALIPAAIGSLMFICALFCRVSRPIGMHAALVVALIGIAGSVMPLKARGFDLSQLAVQTALAMDALLIFLIVMAVRSFIAARKARKA